MKLYKKKRSDKKKPSFECENEIQSSGTVENLTTGCQSEICEKATTKETTKGNRKNPSFECENEIQRFGTVENSTTGCQGEICEQATTKETKKGNGKNMDDVIKRFQNIVSQGPLYICSCCDQLWYKHSVSTADKIRKSNPTAANYLRNRKSINNTEWLCRTCQNYLVKFHQLLL